MTIDIERRKLIAALGRAMALWPLGGCSHFYLSGKSQRIP
jgi:hypothetical protein